MNKILEFLKEQCEPCSTAYIARYGLYPEHFEWIKKYPNIWNAHPSRNDVSSTYYYLSNLAKQGLVEQCSRGKWRLIETPSISSPFAPGSTIGGQ